MPNNDENKIYYHIFFEKRRGNFTSLQASNRAGKDNFLIRKSAFLLWHFDLFFCYFLVSASHLATMLRL